MRELIFAEADANLSFAVRGEDTLIMTPGGEVFTFNALQVEILRSLDGKTELGEVARRCSEKLGQDIGADELREFLRDAKSIGLLSLRTAGPSDANAANVEAAARSLFKRFEKEGLPPPGLPAPLQDFAGNVMGRLAAGDARGAAAAVNALKSVAPKMEWIQYLEREVERLLRPSSRVTFGLGRVTIPLFNPGRTLTFLDRWLGWVYGWWGLLLWAGIVALGIALSPPVAMLGISQYFHGPVLLVMYVCLALSILIHELSHALTCHHYGGRVQEIGIGWLYWGPMAFADVTSSYLFENKRHRLLVMFAGTMGSLLSLSLGAFLWILVRKGSSIDLGLRAFLFGEWIGVLFNLVPFRKTDGYFLISDILGIEDLNRRSAAFMRTTLGRLLMGDLVEPSEESRRNATLLLTYGALDALFIGFIYLVMIPMSYDRTPPDARRLFVLLMTYSTGMLIIPLGKGIWKTLAFAGGRSREVFAPTRVWRWGLPFGLLLTGLLLPCLPETTKAPFVLRAEDRVDLRSEVAGQVISIPAQGGTSVVPGQLVAVLQNPDLELQRGLAQAELEHADAELARFTNGATPQELALARSAVELSGAELHKAAGLARREPEREALGLSTADTLAAIDDVAAQAIEASRIAASSLDLVNAGSRREDILAARAHVEAARRSLAALDLQRSKLEIRSPIAGVIDDIDLSVNLGRWLKGGETLARVVNRGQFVGELSPDWLLDPQRVVGGGVELVLRDGRSLRGTIARTLLQSTDATHHGVTLETSALEARGLVEGLTGTAVIYGPREPLLIQLVWHPLLRFLKVVLWAAL